MPTFDLDGLTVPYTLVRRAGMRRIRLVITPDGLRVSCAPRVARKDVDAALRDNAAWLRRRRDDLTPGGPRPFLDGDLLPLLGGEVELGLRVGEATGTVFHAEDGRLAVCVPVGSDIDAAIASWYSAVADERLREIVRRRSGELGVSPRRVVTRDARTRWGSCSARGDLALNWRLAMAPYEVADYVAVHELAHLLELNHSTRFWAHVSRVLPDYRRSQHWLNRHGMALLRARPRPA